MHNLDATIRASNERLHRRLDQMESLVSQVLQQHSQLIEQNTLLIKDIRKFRKEKAQPQRRQQKQTPPPAPALASPPPPLPPAPTPARQEEEPSAPARLPPPILLCPPPRTPPRIPVVQRKLPDSFLEIWHEWRANELASFMNDKAKSKTWGSDIYNAWHKRRLIVQKIEELAKAGGVSFEDKLQQVEHARMYYTKNRKGTRPKTADTMLRDWQAHQERQRRSSETRGRKRKEGESSTTTRTSTTTGATSSRTPPPVADAPISGTSASAARRTAPRT